MDQNILYSRMRITDYLRELSARKPVPGGGSASALTASLAAGLILMVINYTIGSYSDATCPGELVVLRDRQTADLERLTSLIDRDCEVFSSLMAVIKQKKDPSEAYRSAAEVPLDVCRIARNSLIAAEIAAPFAKKGIRADIVCATHLLRAAFSCARFNVEANLTGIKDKALADRTAGEIKTLESDIESVSVRIFDLAA